MYQHIGYMHVSNQFPNSSMISIQLSIDVVAVVTPLNSQIAWFLREKLRMLLHNICRA